MDKRPRDEPDRWSNKRPRANDYDDRRPPRHYSDRSSYGPLPNLPPSNSRSAQSTNTDRRFRPSDRTPPKQSSSSRPNPEVGHSARQFSDIGHEAQRGSSKPKPDTAHEAQQMSSKPKPDTEHEARQSSMQLVSIKPEPESLQHSYQLRPTTSPKPEVPGFTNFKVHEGLPELPPLAEHLAGAPFKHKSLYGYDRTTAMNDLSYERLEFLGDAYLELIATRLIFHNFDNLPAGQQSQARELLVKNETLAAYALQYKFDERLEAHGKAILLNPHPTDSNSNKKPNKILGDVFESYVAAVILSDMTDGFSIAEKWLTALWTPKLMEYRRTEPKAREKLIIPVGDSPLTTYDPTAKPILQKKLESVGVRLQYKPYRDPEELKGDNIGKNRHYIALYLTGYGYTNFCLGQGEGSNKVEAGNWAAIRALHGKHSGVVAECEAKASVIQAASRAARAALREAEKAENEAK